MALIDRVRERTGSDLSDAELGAMLTGIVAELDVRLGPAGPVTIELGDPTDPHSRFYRTLRLTAAIGTGAVTIVEVSPGNSGVASEVTLSAGDYRVIHGGRTLQRLTTGPHGAEFWAPLVRVTYTPAGVPQSSRDEAAIKLMLIDLSARGAIKSERAGDYQVTLGDTEAEREKVFAGLTGPRGMVFA